MAKKDKEFADKIMKELSHKSGRGNDGRGTTVSNKNSLILGIIAVVLVAVIVFTAIIVGSKNKHDDEQTQSDSISALSKVDDKTGKSPLDNTATYIAGAASAGKTIDIFQDALCPACAQFENARGEEVAAAVAKGDYKVRYHFLHFLDQASHSKNYSLRAAIVVKAFADALEVPKDDESAQLKRSRILANFQKILYSPNFAPAENSPTDHSTEELKQVALKTLKDTDGKLILNIDLDKFKQKFDGLVASVETSNQVKAQADEAMQQLQSTSTTGDIGTPSIISNGKLIADPFSEDIFK